MFCIMKLDRSTIPDPPSVLTHNGLVLHVGKKIGEGGFAKCYEAMEEQSGRKFALKAVHSKAVEILQAKNKLLNEIEIHHRLDHRYVVKLYRTFQHGQFIYLVMELCENRTLVEVLKKKKRLCEAEARYYLWMILDGVRYLHGHQIVHRDLKLGNIFLNLEYDVKLGDFGLATTLEHEGDRKRTMCGTPNYIAPEVLYGKETGHGFEVDVWAIGIIMYTLLFGKPPFQSSEIPDIYNKIRALSYTFPEQSNVSEVARDLIRMILTSDPTQRPKLDDISKHVFFRNILIQDPNAHELGDLYRVFSLLQIKTNTRKSERKDDEKENTRDEDSRSGSYQSSLVIRNKKQGVVETVYRKLCEYMDNKRQPLQVTSNSSNDRKQQIVSGNDRERMGNSDGCGDFYVERWIDYTDKYGIGYVCSRGNVGAYFNDSTTMVYNVLKGWVDYQETQNGQVVKTRYSIEEYPSTLNKKMVIIKHFAACFSKYVHGDLDSLQGSEYVTRYAKVKEGIVFRLSTRSIQIMFNEGHSIVMSMDGEKATMIKNGDRRVFVLNEMFNSRLLPEFGAVFQTVRQILGTLVSG